LVKGEPASPDFVKGEPASPDFVKGERLRRIGVKGGPASPDFVKGDPITPPKPGEAGPRSPSVARFTITITITSSLGLP
jgi:hypothetical protein